MRRRTVSVLLAVVVVAGAAACGSDGEGGSDGRLRIVAGFYPLEWMAASVGGPHVEVESLATGGQEPHDLELAPRDVAALVDADAVVYLSGFQPAVDEAIDQAEPDARLRRRTVRRSRPRGRRGHGRSALLARPGAPPRGHARVRRASCQKPTRRTRADYAAGRAEVDAKLAALDADLREGLASCERRPAGHQPRRVRLPRGAVRPDTGRHQRVRPPRPSPRRPTSPRSRGSSRSTTSARSTSRRSSARTSRRRSRRDRRPHRGPRPDRGADGIVGRRRLPRGDALEPREPPHRAAMPVTARQPCP